jgi:hypothetical protein
LLSGGRRISFRIPDAGFGIRVQRGRFREGFVVLINNCFHDGNLLRASWVL